MGTVNAITSIARIYFWCNWYSSMQLSGICLDAIGWWQSAKFLFFNFQVIDRNAFNFVRLLGGSDVTAVADVRIRWVNKGLVHLSGWLVSCNVGAVTFVRNNYRRRSKCRFPFIAVCCHFTANRTRHHRRSHFQFSRHTRAISFDSRQVSLVPANRLPTSTHTCPWLVCRIGCCCNCL